jgi:glutathione peroxidase-family protein
MGALSVIVVFSRMATSAHEFDVVMNDGSTQSMSVYEGHPTLVVNGASKWGVTDREYTQLQQLHDQFSAKGLKIIVFPCNQFKSQEPGDDATIRAFVNKYNYQGDLAAKCDVNGDNAHPLWAWMKNQKSQDDIKWNFAKFLLDQEGNVVKCENSRPPSESINLAPTIEKLFG